MRANSVAFSESTTLVARTRLCIARASLLRWSPGIVSYPVPAVLLDAFFVGNRSAATSVSVIAPDILVMDFASVDCAVGVAMRARERLEVIVWADLGFEDPAIWFTDRLQRSVWPPRSVRVHWLVD